MSLAYVTEGDVATPAYMNALLQQVAGAVFDVTAYGAVGDGVTDDTTVIQAAITAAGVSGRNVVTFPAGYTFKVSSRLTVASAMTLRVDGIIATTGYLYEANPTAIFYITADDVVLEGTGKLQGPGSFSHDTVDDLLKIPSLVRIQAADNVMVRGLTFLDGPQACVVYYDSDFIKILDNTFVGGDTVANCFAGINYYAIHGYDSDFGLIADNRIVDDASGNTFAEGVFLYFSDHTKIIRNFFKNVVDHDVYLYHSVADTSGANNYNIVDHNTSFSTLTYLSQKIGASFKAHGEFNSISHNTIINPTSGIVLEGGSYSTIANNTISGFNTQGIIVSDLVATNAAGQNYITIANNTLQGASGAASSGIFFRGDATFSTANAVGGKIVGNTIIRCGDAIGTSESPIFLVHSNTSYFMDNFLVADNIIIAQGGVYGMYVDRARFSKFTNNIIKDGTFTAWRGLHFAGNSTFNEITHNTVRDDQGTPLLAIGCNFGAATCTDIILAGNIFHSLYASRETNPWRIDPALRITGDRNLHDDTLGYPVALTTAEATAAIEADASTTISVAVPSGARLIGVQLRVDTALAVGELWDAAYSGGSTTAIATAQAVAKNTKVNVLYDANAAVDITTNTTNIAITRNGGGSFTAQGTIRALVYYESLTTLGNAP